MPAPKTANGLQVEMRYTSLGENVENVFHLLSDDGTPPGEQMTTAATVFTNWWAEMALGNFATTIALREVYVVDLTAVDGATYTYTPAAPIPGAHPSPALPNNVALCATKRTNQRGRAYRGRTYFCGIPEEVVTGNNVSASYASDVNLDCSALMVSLSEANLTMGVLSKKLDGVWRPTGIITPVVTFSLRDTRTDSQRGRLP